MLDSLLGSTSDVRVQPLIASLLVVAAAPESEDSKTLLGYGLDGLSEEDPLEYIRTAVLKWGHMCPDGRSTRQTLVIQHIYMRL